MKKTTGLLLVLGVLGAGLATGSRAGAVKAKVCQCVEYTRSATGIKIYGNGNDWDNNAKSYRYKLSSTPVTNGAINFEAKAYGAHSLYGHVGKVKSYKSSSNGKDWIITVRHANWPSNSMFTELGCSNVSEKTFTIRKGDSSVHYIY